MRLGNFLASFAVTATFLGLARAQVGTLDQTSPWPSGGNSAWFNGDASSLIWQAQVGVGLAGPLEGVKLRLAGSQGDQVSVRIRRGAGWTTNPVVFSTQLTKQVAGNEDVFVDMTSANQSFAVGDKFVIELQGNDTGCGLIGSYMDPALGPPFYSEPLFLGGPGCYAGCGWRIGFETWVLSTPPPQPYCTPGTSANGCLASITASATPKVNHSNACQINVTGVAGQRAGILFYGLQQFVQPWCSQGASPSLLCVKAPTYRTTVQSSGGTLGSCDGALTLDWNAFQLANPGALGAPWNAGEQVFVQGWYRDPASCKTTSLSNALKLTYVP